MTLNQLKVGNSAVITTVGGDGALRCRLLDMGLIPHTRVTLQKVAPMGDPIEIRVRGYELTLRVEEAQKIQRSHRIQSACRQLSRCHGRPEDGRDHRRKRLLRGGSARHLLPAALYAGGDRLP